MTKKRSSSSTRWLQEHNKDPFVIQAQKLNLRSRAHFKLAEIQEKTKFIKPGMQIIDLGAAPGAWSVLAAQLIGRSGKLISSDLLTMPAIKNQIFIQGDFNNQQIQQQIIQHCNSKKVDIILSDIAPNTSGIKNADQLKAIQLAESVLAFSEQHLSANGVLLVKLFHGIGFDDYLKQARQLFDKIKIFKPQASRNRSTECYLLATSHLD